MRWPRNKTYGIYLADLDRARTDSQGIISYALALTRAVGGALQPDERLVVLCSAAVRPELGTVPSQGTVEVVEVDARRRALSRISHEQLAVPMFFHRAGVGVVHFPKGRTPSYWRGAAKVIATVHDDIPMQYVAGTFGAFRSLKTSYVVAVLRRTLRVADLVLTDSEFSRRQLEPMAAGTQIRVVVPGLGFEPQGPMPDDAARAPRLLVFDSPFPHKRSDEAAAFTARYVLERRLDGHEVLLLGTGRAAQLREWYPDLVRHEEGPVGTERVAELVRTSRALVVASRYEGLGLPPLEAWAEGTPAVVADCEAAREATLGAPGLYRQGDFGSFAHALDDVLGLEPAEREVWAKQMRDRYDWSRAAEEALAAYRDVAR